MTAARPGLHRSVLAAIAAGVLATTLFGAGAATADDGLPPAPDDSSSDVVIGDIPSGPAASTPDAAAIRSEAVAEVPVDFIDEVVPGDGSAVVRWHDSGGAEPVSGWTVRYTTELFSGWEFYDTDLQFDFSGWEFAELPAEQQEFTISGLQNGLPVAISVRRNDDLADGAFATPRTVPGAPEGLTATPGVRTVTLAWSPPVSDGGSPVTGYVVEWRLAGTDDVWLRADAATSPWLATPDGERAIQFRTRAVNVAGEGPVSAVVVAAPLAPPRLAATGGTVPLVAVLVGAGILLLGVVLVVIVGRRQRAGSRR